MLDPTLNPDWVGASVEFLVDGAAGADRNPVVLFVAADAEVRAAALRRASEVLRMRGIPVVYVGAGDDRADRTALLGGSRAAVVIERADLAPEWVTRFRGFLSTARSHQCVAVAAVHPSLLAEATSFTQYGPVVINLDDPDSEHHPEDAC